MFLYFSYGDYVPSSNIAKAFMIVWILTGLTIVSIFGGAVSSGMSVATLDKVYQLYGTKVRILTRFIINSYLLFFGEHLFPIVEQRNFLNTVLGRE